MQGLAFEKVGVFEECGGLGGAIGKGDCERDIAPTRLPDDNCANVVQGDLLATVEKEGRDILKAQGAGDDVGAVASRGGEGDELSGGGQRGGGLQRIGELKSL